MSLHSREINGSNPSIVSDVPVDTTDARTVITVPGRISAVASSGDIAQVN